MIEIIRSIEVIMSVILVLFYGFLATNSHLKYDYYMWNKNINVCLCNIIGMFLNGMGVTILENKNIIPESCGIILRALILILFFIIGVLVRSGKLFEHEEKETK